MVGEGSTYRSKIIRLMTFLGGVYFFLYFITPASVLSHVGIEESHGQISNGFITIGVMALGLGIVNLLVAHGSKVAFARRGWINSAALLVGMFAMFFASAGQWIQEMSITKEVRRVQIIPEFAQRIAKDEKDLNQQGVDALRAVPPLAVRVQALTTYTTQVVGEVERAAEQSSDNSDARRVLRDELRNGRAEIAMSVQAISALSWDSFGQSQQRALDHLAQEANKVAGSYFVLRRIDRESSVVQKTYDVLFDGLFNHLGSAMFALLGVYIAAAAYRAFRIQTFESALMMCAAIIVMLGQISFGREIYEHMPAVRQWLLEVPNSAAFRAIRVGAAVAGLMLAIRMWLSIESRSFSSGKK